MIKALLYGALIYFAYTLLKGYKVLSSGMSKQKKKKNIYKKYDIRDAEYEDVNNEKGNDHVDV